MDADGGKVVLDAGKEGGDRKIEVHEGLVAPGYNNSDQDSVGKCSAADGVSLAGNAAREACRGPGHSRCIHCFFTYDRFDVADDVNGNALL